MFLGGIRSCRVRAVKLIPPSEKRTNQLSVRLSDSELRRLDELVTALRIAWNRDDIDRIDVMRSAVDAAWQEICGGQGNKKKGETSG